MWIIVKVMTIGACSLLSEPRSQTQPPIFLNCHNSDQTCLLFRALTAPPQIRVSCPQIRVSCPQIHTSCPHIWAPNWWASGGKGRTGAPCPPYCCCLLTLVHFWLQFLFQKLQICLIVSASGLCSTRVMSRESNLTLLRPKRVESEFSRP